MGCIPVSLTQAPDLLTISVTIDYATSNPSPSTTLYRPTPPLPPAFLIPHRPVLNIFELLDSLDWSRRWDELGWGNEPLGLPL